MSTGTREVWELMELEGYHYQVLYMRLVKAADDAAKDLEEMKALATMNLAKLCEE